MDNEGGFVESEDNTCEYEDYEFLKDEFLGNKEQSGSIVGSDSPSL